MSTLHGSAQLPPQAARNPRLHDLGLLNSTTFISDLSNETTAGTLTRAGLTIQVSFVLADPPRLSYFCVYCLNRKEIPFAYPPKVVSSMEDTALIEVGLTTEKWPEYFLYRARGRYGVPSLDLLPDIPRSEFLYPPLGFVSHDNRKQFVMAALSYGTGDEQCYNLHTIGSEPHSTWSKKVLQLKIPDGLSAKSAVICPTEVISLGGGLLGWVDLWKGILICDVLKPTATASFIPMPKLLPSNIELYGNQYSARSIRDVTFSHGYIKCVEFEELVQLRAIPAVADPWDMDELHDFELAINEHQEEEEEVYDVVGWRLITWYRELTWNGWRKGSTVRSDDLGTVSLPQLGGGACALNAPFIKKLKTASPTLRGDDVVYLVSMLEEDARGAWILTVDTNKKSVREVMLFSAEGSSVYDPTFIPCVLSKYLDAKSDGAQAGKRNASHVQPSGNFNKLKKQQQVELEEQKPVPQLLQHS